MELIERYIYAVTKRLPETQREDVAKELRGNIEDMLSDNPSQHEVEGVLIELGEPSKLATEYRGKKRYLVGPEYFDQYVSVLKIVAIILASISFVSVFLENYFSFGLSDKNAILFFGGTFGKAFGGAVQGAIQAFFWVTVTYFFIGKSLNSKDSKLEKKWSPSDLLAVPKVYKKKIYKAELIGDVIGTFLMVYLLWEIPNIVGLVPIGNKDLYTISSLFNLDHIQSYAILFFIYAIGCVGVNIFKWIIGYWNYMVATVDAIYHFIGFVLFARFINDMGNYNRDQFFSLTNSELNEFLVEVNKNLVNILTTNTAIVALIIVIVSAQSFYKAYKNHSK
jgi:hypothetical protein